MADGATVTTDGATTAGVTATTDGATAIITGGMDTGTATTDTITAGIARTVAGDDRAGRPAHQYPMMISAMIGCTARILASLDMNSVPSTSLRAASVALASGTRRMPRRQPPGSFSSAPPCQSLTEPPLG